MPTSRTATIKPPTHGHRPTRRRPNLIGEVIIAFILVEVYDYLRGVLALHEQEAFSHARDILTVEGWLHLDFEWGLNHWIVQYAGLANFSVYWYEFTHVGGTLAALAFCYMLFPAVYRSARNALIGINVVGMLIFYMLPVAPPRLLPHAGYVDLVEWAGFDTTHYGPVKEAQFGAMPSLHMAWALWVGLVLWVMLRRFRWRLVAFVYPLLTAAAVVVTGNHYVLDVFAGVVLAVAALAVTGFFAHRHPLRRGREHDTATTSEAGEEEVLSGSGAAASAGMTTAGSLIESATPGSAGSQCSEPVSDEAPESRHHAQ